jgi:hypothetical protein
MVGRPFFIIGSARSGTNLLARLLDNHRDIRVALDPAMPVFRSMSDAIVADPKDPLLSERFPAGCPFQDYYFEALGHRLLDAVLSADAAMPLSSDEVLRLRDACAARASLESGVIAEAMAGLNGRTYAGIFESIFSIIGDSAPDAAWAGCKEVWIQEFIPVLARSLPECRFLCIERDPRAVVASLLAVTKHDPSQAAHTPSYMRHWRKGVALTRRYLADPELASRVLLVRYEDLVADPEHGAQKLCEFLNLEFDPAMLALSRDGWNGNSGYEHQEKNVYRGSLDRWMNSLSPEMLATVDFLCGPEMNLTPYKLVASGGTDNSVIECLLNANREKYSWRSDSGDALSDFAWEALRRRIIGGDQTPSDELSRRCFLFPETFQAIQSKRKSKPEQCKIL